MSNRILKNPKTQEQAEQTINWDQDSFAGGMYNDPPASEIPANSLKYLENAIAYPTYLEPRTGSIEYNAGNQAVLPRQRTGLTGTKTDNIITSPDAVFVEEDLKSYWVHDDGTEDEILAILSDTQIRVRNSVTHPVSTNAGIRRPLNAHYYHKEQKIIMLLVGNIVYVSDVNLTSFTAVLNLSVDTPNNAASDMDEMNNYGILFNSKGLYKIQLEGSFYYMWKMNSPVPSVRITSNVDQNNIPADRSYAYKYIYTMTRLKGMGHGRDRLSIGTTFEQESGTVIADMNILSDYGVVAKVTPITDGSGNGQYVGDLTVPVSAYDATKRERHWNYYSVYRTLDIGTNGINPINGEGNNAALFAWAGDVLICKAYTASADGGIITCTQGQFDVKDIGSVIEFEDGNRIQISGYIDNQNVTYSDEYYYYGSIASQSATVGNSYVMTLWQDNYTVHRTSGQREFTADDVGEPIWWCDGTMSIITEFVDADTVIVHDDTDRVRQGAGINATYRQFYDDIPDNTALASTNFTSQALRARIASQEPLYIPQTRPWTRLPESNSGVVVPGFMFVFVRTALEANYSVLPLGLEYLAGYYNASYHFNDEIDDSIIEMSLFPDRVVAYCKHSVWGGPTNSNISFERLDIGIVITQFAGFSKLDADIGLADHGGIQNSEGGRQIMITNEKGSLACREFDGYQFGPDKTMSNQGDMKLIREQLNSMYPSFASAYIDGEFIIWGIEGI